VYRGEIAATARADDVPIALTDLGRHYRSHRSLVASTDALAILTIPATPRPYLPPRRRPRPAFGATPAR
jgi:hypothetical protein